MTIPAQGLLVLDKPGGITSRGAVDRALRWFPRGTRVGHTGTLDPLATGVLVLCLGNATRLAEYVQRMRKTYRTVIQLGARSDTDDADGVITFCVDATVPELAIIQAQLGEFHGPISQVPPAFSAAKVTGRRAYDLARAGRDVTLEARQVQVYRIDILRYAYPELELEVHCGKGTYIRSLARDLGERLGCGGLVKTLRRTQVGPFTVDRAVSLDTDPQMVAGALLPAEQALAELPRLTLSEDQARRYRHGQTIALGSGDWKEGEEVAVFDPSGRAVGIAQVLPTRYLKPIKVL